MIIRHRLLVLCAAAIGLCSGPIAVAQPAPATPGAFAGRFIRFCPHAVSQSFPTSGPAQTTWMICWREVAGNDSLHNPNGLVIGPVYFRKSPAAPFIRVLWDLRVSDYFVPYHSGSPRYYDLSLFNFVLTGVTAADCPPSVGGALLSPRVCKEVHDRGLLWKDGASVRRGQELVLWGAIDAANYRYIQEYTFRDDGFIIGRMGATGQNLPTREHETHVHNAIWRADIDLDGVVNDAAVIRHAENPADPTGVAIDSTTAILGATGLQWGARSHDAIQVTAPVKNRPGHQISYHFMPLVTGGGLTQHVEPFTHEDFWVTPYNPAQFAARYLPMYVAGSPSVAHRDLVVWFKGSLHHHPRDEDGVFTARHIWFGTADVMWTGFVLMPHDLFDCSPFYGPCP